MTSQHLTHYDLARTRDVRRRKQFPDRTAIPKNITSPDCCGGCLEDGDVTASGTKMPSGYKISGVFPNNVDHFEVILEYDSVDTLVGPAGAIGTGATYFAYDLEFACGGYAPDIYTVSAVIDMGGAPSSSGLQVWRTSGANCDEFYWRFANPMRFRPLCEILMTPYDLGLGAIGGIVEPPPIPCSICLKPLNIPAP